MNIWSVVSTRERWGILGEVLQKESEFGVSKIAASLGLSKGLVSKYLGILAKEGVLGRKGRKFAVREGSTVRGLRILLTLGKVKPSFFGRRAWVLAAGIFGSCARGANTESSDIDVWVKVGKASEDDRATLASDLRKSMGRVSVLFLDEKKLASLKERDRQFYHALHFGSIVIYGGEDGI